MDEYRVDDLQYKGLRLYQDPAGFCFGTDAVLLASFATVRNGDMIADLGTGSGVIPILLSGRTQFAHCYALEIQPKAAEMAQKSVELNGLQGRITVLCEDLRAWQRPVREGLDAVICNPPYKKVGSALQNETESHALSRHELCCTMNDVAACAARLLKNGGRLTMIHQSERAAELICCMRENGIEPKRMRLVQAREDKPPKLILIEGVRQGKPYLRWEPTLILQNRDGSETQELQKIYHRGEWAEV